MPAHAAPGLGLRTGFTPGESGWGDEYNEDMLKLSALVQLRVISMTTPLPLDDSNSAAVADGDIYIMPVSDSNSIQDSNSSPAHGTIAVFDNGGWIYYTPLPGFRAWVNDLQAFYVFKSGTWQADGGSALNIAYDSGETGDSNSTQTSVAAALDDLYLRIRNLSIGAVSATTVSYDAGDIGDSNSTETTVQGALDDIYSRVRALGGGSGITFTTVSSSFTVAAADDKKFYLVSEDSNSGAFVDIGLPEDGLEDVPDTFSISAVQLGDGSQVRFVGIEDSNSPAAVILLYPADMQPQTRGQNSVITAVKTSVANTWLVFGDLDPV